MNTKLDTRPAVEISEFVPLSQMDLIEAVAASVKNHSMVNLGGIDLIEHLPVPDVAVLPITGTVFEVMADKARMFGVEVDNTVGGVMEAIYRLERNTTAMRDYAHEIGCHCRGDYISPDVASARILNVGKLVAS